MGGGHVCVHACKCVCDNMNKISSFNFLDSKEKQSTNSVRRPLVFQ